MEFYFTRLKKLEKLSDKDECDGECDMKPPYEQCKECLASETLNVIADMLREFDEEA